MFGHRSLYHDGWRAVCPWPGTSFTESGLTFGAPIDYNKLIELDEKGWELYNLNEDFTETTTLAGKERGRLIAMIGMWYVEAGKYKVLPIDSRGTQRIAEERPKIAEGRKQYVYYPGTQVAIGMSPTGGEEAFAVDEGASDGLPGSIVYFGAIYLYPPTIVRRLAIGESRTLPTWKRRIACSGQTPENDA